MKRRDQILNLAIELIQERGGLGWSYEDISSEVGIRKASIHYHFPKKEDLIIESTRTYIVRSIDHIERTLKHANHLKEKIASIANCYRQVFCQKDKLCLCLALSQHCSNQDVNLIELIKGFFQTMHQMLHDILKEGKEIGEVKTEIDPESMATTILALLQGLLLLGEYGWTEENFDSSLKQIIDLLSKK